MAAAGVFLHDQVSHPRPANFHKAMRRPAVKVEQPWITVRLMDVKGLGGLPGLRFRIAVGPTALAVVFTSVFIGDG